MNKKIYRIKIDFLNFFMHSSKDSSVIKWGANSPGPITIIFFPET